MGDHCNIAYYESENDELLQYQLLLFKSRHGDPYEVCPILAMAVLEIYFKRKDSSGKFLTSTGSVKNFLLTKLGESGFSPAQGFMDDLFTTHTFIDYFYAVYNTNRIDVYSMTGKNWDILLPNKEWGLKKLKSMNLLELLREIPGAD